MIEEWKKHWKVWWNPILGIQIIEIEKYGEYVVVCDKPQSRTCEYVIEFLDL